MKEGEERGGLLSAWACLTLAFVATLALMALSGCRARYIEVPSLYAVHDTLRQTTHTADSIWLRDSIYVEGQTKYHERTIYRYKIKTDTLYAVRTDTARISVPYPVEVAKPIAWYDKAALWLGRCCIIAAILWLIFLYIKRRT